MPAIQSMRLPGQAFTNGFDNRITTGHDRPFYLRPTITPLFQLASRKISLPLLSYSSLWL